MGGGAKKAARIQAQATREAAEAQAKQSRLQAQAAQQQQENAIQRERAMKAAQALQENQKVQEVEVDDTINQDNYELDELGRRRAPREAFRVRRSNTFNI